MKIKKKSNAVRVPPLKKAIKVKRKSLDAAESVVSKALENVKKVLEVRYHMCIYILYIVIFHYRKHNLMERYCRRKIRIQGKRFQLQNQLQQYTRLIKRRRKGSLEVEVQGV